MYLIGRKSCAFYFSHIHAEEVQNRNKSVSNSRAKDSARWLIRFTLKKLCLIFFAFTFIRIDVQELNFQRLLKYKETEHEISINI